MPILTIRDDGRRRLTHTITDPWSAEDIAGVLDRQLVSGLWDYAVIYDMRGTASIPTEPDMLWLVKYGQQRSSLHGTRGPVAVLVDVTTHAALLRRYSEYSAVQSRLNLRVFTDAAAVDEWLAGPHD